MDWSADGDSNHPSGNLTPRSEGSEQFETDTSLTDDSVLEHFGDVAVVGMACRAAGGNHSPEQLWQSILGKSDSSGEMPDFRWEPYHRRDVRNTKILNSTTTRGYFLDKLEDFDAAFFGISPKEAEQMDPQQRISLEVAWEALENAGIPPQSLSGSDTAVFMGVNSDDYSKLLLEDLPGLEPWMGIGTAYCGVPNRISYHLNLVGPSTAVDAACASSLVAIHHGRQAILSGECKVALAGGVNALCGPGLTGVLDKAGATSPEGRCRSFDDAANGYGRGEGAAVIVLKRMANAMADGDHILAVLKGSAVAQDGRTNGIMAPNAKSQELVAMNALKCADIDPLTVQYVEAHATSTPLGDPTEVSAIAAVYGKNRPASEPCFIGSIKPNVGHLEAGAGAMGFIKAVLAIQKGILPPQANLNSLNSRINWDESGVRVVREESKWPATKDLRRAAVCSYGYGGTVSHAVVEQYNRSAVRDPPATVDSDTSGPQVLLISAPRENRLTAQASEQKTWIDSHGKEYQFSHVASTLATRRNHHDYRAAFVVDDHANAAQVLKSFCEKSNTTWTASSRVLSDDTSKDTVWVFSGHGAQWNGMGKELLGNPLFRDTIEELDHIAIEEAGFSALKALRDGQFDDTDKVQVLTYLMQVGLSAVLMSKGIEPKVVIGHSVGEIAAAVVAGCLTSEEGMQIVSRRAKLYQRCMGAGAMILVNIPVAEAQKELAGWDDIVVAIESSPSSCVISGKTEQVEKFSDSLKTREIPHFRVKTDIAFHSPMLSPIIEPLSSALASTIQPQKSKIRLYSTSTADARSAELRGPEYWVHNTVNPVLLSSAVGAAIEDGFRIFLEVSSHPIVSHSIRETIMDKGIEDFAVVSTLSRNQPAEKCLLYSIAQIHCRGGIVNWKRQMTAQWVSNMPTTAWSHKPVWRKIEAGPLNRDTLHDTDKHTLLGERINIAGESTVFYKTSLNENNKPFPGSHPLHGSEIVPAAALINTFLHASGVSVISNIVLRVPVAISGLRDIQVVVQQGQIKICSRLVQENRTEADEISWVTHTTGQLLKNAPNSAAPREKIDIAAVKACISTRVADNFSIDYLDKVGVSAMGFPWAISEHYGNLNEMIARVDVAPALPEGSVLPWDASSWAPILDAATSVGSTLFMDRPRLRMPAQIEKAIIYTEAPPPKVGYLYVQKASEGQFAVHVGVLDEAGNILAQLRSMRFSEIEGTPGVSGSVESLVHQVAWPPASYTEKPLSIARLLLVCDDDELTESYITSLSGRRVAIDVVPEAQELSQPRFREALERKDSAIVYIPGRVATVKLVAQAAERFISETLDIIKLVVNSSFLAKVFVLTGDALLDGPPTALAHGPLQGLGRIVASEHPDTWGGLIETETRTVPLEVMKYVQEADIIRMTDGIPRVACLRPMPRDRLHPAERWQDLLPRPEGTYLVTGGLGALGLEVASFLVEKGARRLVLLSRRSLPPRREWQDAVTESGPFSEAISKILDLESCGASVYCLAIDISAPFSTAALSNALEALSLPPVLGVVHAAGVLEDQLVLAATADSFSRVLAPKVAGTLALDELFPPGELDFMVLFSSCGQLFGFPGQASYASGNAFLDVFAAQRRARGDRRTVSIQWTSWRGMGMAASTDFIDAELASKGITDITQDEAFRAWMHVAKYDVDNAAVLRSCAFEADERLPSPMLREIAIRKAGTAAAEGSPAPLGPGDDFSKLKGAELKSVLNERIRDCVAKVLQLGSADDVDSKATLNALGVDSVMTVALRGQLQKSIGIKVPPTLTWSCPTVEHLAGWFLEKLEAGN